MSVPSLLSIFGNSGKQDPVYVDDVFSTFVYSGTGNPRTITNGIDLAGEGGLVWTKGREPNGFFHALADTENGVGGYLFSNTTGGWYSNSTSITAFNSDGYSIGTSTDGNLNATTSNAKFVSWTFRKQKGFFDVVTWSGTNTNRDIAHNLGSVPGMVIVKKTSASDAWYVYHRSTGATKYLELNLTGNGHTSSATWNNTTPTSSVFTVGSFLNATGSTYVAYIFAHDDASFGTDEDESIIKCGSYTGSNTNIGVLQNLGFEPQWLLIKNTSRSESWLIFDNMRGVVTGDVDKSLEPQASASEQTQELVQFEATGFRPMGSDSKTNNGDSFIYMAIRRPHKPLETGTEVFAIDTGGATSPSPPQFTSNFPVDMVIQKPSISQSANWKVRDRLLGLQKLTTNDTDEAEDDGTDFGLDFNNGFKNSNSVNADDLAYMFKRAPGFFDVVTYEGNFTTGRQITHNLEVVPELIIVKRWDAAGHWGVYHKDLPLDGGSQTQTQAVFLNLSTGPGGYGFLAGHNYQTATHFTTWISSEGDWNKSNADYISYLFATLPGVSKVGSYSGTGNAINVDCGFTNGARFILIKRDGTGDWYVWDTLRGITSGNDKYLRLNENNEQVTNTDYVDPLSTGFTVTSSAPAALNTSGGTYLFLAVA